MPARYFNWKLAIVLVISLIVLGVSAFGLRQWRRTNRAEQSLILGNKAYDQHKWKEAAEQLGIYIALERDDVATLLKYADAQLKVRPVHRNRVQRATEAYRTVLRLERENSQAAMLLTKIYLDLGSPGEAELIARRQLASTDNPGLRRMLALALAGQRKFKEAAAELETIIKEHPEQILAYETLGRLIEQRPEDLGDMPSEWFDRAVANNPSSALAYIIRAGFRRQSEDFPAALEDLAQAEKQDLSDSEVRLRLAKELINLNALDRAEVHLGALEEVCPDNEDLWTTWAGLALKSQSKEKMLKVAETGLKELSAQPWDFMPTAADLFIRCDRLEDADDCISKMRQEGISPASVEFLQGRLAAEQGRLSDAVKYWRQSIESGNKSAQVRLALASALSGLGNMQSAIQQLRLLLSENPGSFEGYLSLAKLLARTGDWAEAADAAARAVALWPDNQEAVLLYLQAQIQLLFMSPGEQGPANAQMLSNIRQRLAKLEKNAGSVGQVKLLRFKLALQQDELTEAESLIAQLNETDLPKAEIAMAQAELLTAQDKTEQAALRLNEAVKESPESIDLVRHLAILHYREGSQKECEACVKEALERIDAPIAQRELGLLLAQFYSRWQRNDRVYTLLEELAAKLPDDIPVKRRLLMCKQVIDDPEQAQKIVDDIKSVEGQDGWQWRYEQAKLWFAMEDFKSHYPQILSLLQKNMRTNPNDRISHLLLAGTYKRAGEMRLAISTYREILSQSPDDLRVIIPAVAALYSQRQYDEAEQILNRASRKKLYRPELQRLRLQSYLRQGRLDSASEILENLLVDDPDNQSACLSLALLKIQQGDYDQASELLDRLKLSDPNSLAVNAARIQLSIRQGKKAEALRICDQVVDNLDTASAYILRARTYATLRQAEKAVKDLDRAVSIEPDNTEVWASRSDFYRSMGQIKNATADIKQALSLDPDNLQLQKRAIPLFLVSGNLDLIREGKDILENALESNSDDIDFRLLKARSVLVEGTAPAVERAKQILQEITEDQPENAEAWLLLGQIEMKQGRPAKAMEAALGGLAYGPDDKLLLLLKARAEAAKSPVLAIPTLKLLLELDPHDLDAAVMMADTYIEMDEPQKAVNLLTEQLAVCDASQWRRCSSALAFALYKSGDKAAAQEQFDSLLESEPNDPGPLLAQVKLLKDDKDWDRLSEKVINWYRSHPEDNSTLVSVAGDLMRLQDEQAGKTAEKILRTAVENNSDSAAAMRDLAILLQIRGRPAEAAQLYERVLELEPDNVIAVNNLAWIICEVRGEPKEALDLAQRGLKIAPDYCDLIDTRGVIYYRLGEYDKAVHDFNECIKLYPGVTSSSVGTRFYLARALAKLGQKDKAIQYLKEALELNSQKGALSTVDLADAQSLLEQLQEGK